MRLNFTKMHGLGNDFVVIDNLHGQINLDSDMVRLIANRRMGIGCDQVLLFQKCNDTSADFVFKFYNTDGSEAAQCGNGVRCLGRFLVENAIVDKKVIYAKTLNGTTIIHVDNFDAIRVNMGMPEFEPDKIPLLYDQRQRTYEIELSDEIVQVYSVSIGNPHAVMLVDNITTARVLEIGQQLKINPKFPDSVNVGFMQILDRSHVKLRVNERGVGETLACGSGACAAVVSCILDQRLDNEVVVELKEGNLVINWEGEGTEVWMTGPATTVYNGQINL
jgi:diaminopimelate epimerase